MTNVGLDDLLFWYILLFPDVTTPRHGGGHSRIGATSSPNHSGVPKGETLGDSVRLLLQKTEVTGPQYDLCRVLRFSPSSASLFLLQCALNGMSLIGNACQKVSVMEVTAPAQPLMWEKLVGAFLPGKGK